MRRSKLSWFAAWLATAVSVALLVLPAYLGGGIHAALLIPIGLSGIALAAGRAGDLWAGILLLIYSIVGGFSVGMFYVPSAVLFLLAFVFGGRPAKRNMTRRSGLTAR